MKIFGSIFALFMIVLLAYTLVGGPVAEMPARPCRFAFNIITPIAARFVGAIDPESERGTREGFDSGQQWCASTVYAMTAGTDWFSSTGELARKTPNEAASQISRGSGARSVEMPDSSGVLLARPETAAALKALPASRLPAVPPAQATDGSVPVPESK